MTTNRNLEHVSMPTPVGPLTVTIEGGAVVEICFAPLPPSKDPVESSALAKQVSHELSEYFSGKLTRFSVSIDFTKHKNLGAFERAVLSELLTIPYGQTISYAGLAARCGSPRAARAVGNAMRKNPIPVIVPCHRVINADGSTGRYSGGEGVKPFLLQLEKRDRS